MLRYCQADRKAVGIVVSQDGHTRVIASVGRSMTLWDEVKLLGHQVSVRSYARMMREWREGRASEHIPYTRGFGPMPKTMAALLNLGRETRRGVDTKGVKKG